MKLRIFLINEDVSIRKTFKEHLESLGHQVIMASEPFLCAEVFFKRLDPLLVGTLAGQWLKPAQHLVVPLLQMSLMQPPGCEGRLRDLLPRATSPPRRRRVSLPDSSLVDALL